MTKYKQYFEEMVKLNQVLFDEFKDIHDKFMVEPAKWQGEFDEKGKKVWEVINEWEKRLCNKMDGGKNSKFTEGLSEKFRGETKKVLPRIDLVGVKITFG